MTTEKIYPVSITNTHANFKIEYEGIIDPASFVIIFKDKVSFNDYNLHGTTHFTIPTPPLIDKFYTQCIKNLSDDDKEESKKPFIPVKDSDSDSESCEVIHIQKCKRGIKVCNSINHITFSDESDED